MTGLVRKILGRLGVTMAVMAMAATLTSCPDLTPPPGDMKYVDVGGYNVAYWDAGTGPHTVVLMSGLNNKLTIWNKVQPTLAQTERVISYDRGGVGWSDHGPNPRDGKAIVAEMHAFLNAISAPPPYYLCAHSFAGLFARLFAATYPSEVAGIVLVDTTHEDRWNRQAQMLDPKSVEMIENIELLTENVLAGYGSIGEWYNRNNTFYQVKANRKLPDIPLVILSEDFGEFSYLQVRDGNLADALEREMDEDQAALVPRGKWVTVVGSGHMIQQQKPEAVIQAVQETIQGW